MAAERASRLVRAGTLVSIRPTPKHRRERGTGLIHLEPKEGVLLEDARIGPEAGWDVYDVQLANGKTTSAYGFDMTPLAKKAARQSHATKSSSGGFETDAERVARSNRWTVAYAAGWLDGQTQAKHGQRRDPSLQAAKDDYARGYSRGYSDHADASGTSTSARKSHATKAGESVPVTRYQVINYDVIGNKRDGFEVNGAYYSNEYVEIPEGASRAEIIRILKDEGILKKAARKESIEIDGEEGYSLYFKHKPTGRPEFELRPVRGS